MGFIWIFPTLQARELLEVALERHPDFAKVNCNNLHMSEDFKFMSLLVIGTIQLWMMRGQLEEERGDNAVARDIYNKGVCFLLHQFSIFLFSFHQFSIFFSSNF